MLLAVSLLTPVPAAAQRALREPQVAGLTAAEITRLFDAYAVVQAQDFLTLDDKQYPQFVQRFRELQETRRRHLQQRTRLVQQLRILTQPEASRSDEALRRSLEEWKELDATERDDIARAIGGVDGVLSLRQQVRFRVFEQQMERRKLELMGRARQGGRAAGRAVPPDDRQ
jgi:hypothetical protein